MVTRLVSTDAWMPAPPERVWAVLTDFNRYADWNPLNTFAVGQGRLGARIPMTIFNPLQPDRPMKMAMRITAFEAGRLLTWVGRVPLLFRGEHSFRMAPADGGTRLLHTEAITGLITRRITDRIIADKFVPAYAAANRALAERLSDATFGA